MPLTRPLGVVLLAATCWVQAGTPTRAVPLTRADVEARLQKTIIAELNVRNAALSDVLEIIRNASEVNVLLHPSARNTAAQVTFNAREVSALAALKAITSITKTVYLINDSYVLIKADTDDSPGKRFQTRSYRVPQQGMNGARKAGARDYLKTLGVPFPSGATARYSFGNGTLIVVNSPENLRRCDIIVRALGGR